MEAKHAGLEETLTRYAEAWGMGDVAATIACYHDEFTLHYFGDNVLSGIHRGKAAALTALATLSRRTGFRLLAVTDILLGTARGAIIARIAYGPASEAAERDRILVYRVEAGLLRECWAYNEDDALLDRLIGAA